MRVLIVDDNALFLEAAHKLLERDGMTVVAVASTGVQAVRRANELRPDVTLVDVDLGNESGFDLARQLTATGGAGSPVILISAKTEEDLEELINASPAIGFVSKSDLSGLAIAELVSAPKGRGVGSAQ